MLTFDSRGGPQLPRTSAEVAEMFYGRVEDRMAAFEKLNEKVQAAHTAWDLGKIDIADFKAGFSDLQSRLQALEQRSKQEK